MLKNLLILICLILIAASNARAFEAESAHRALNVDFTVYEKRALPGTLRNTVGKKSVLRSARPYKGAVLPRATAWGTMEQLRERFAYIRDLRFMKWKGREGFLRRSSWLYPDDGCYARAALANRNLFRFFVPVPSKVFVFGNLRVLTTNSPRGKVGWWYHVAPIVEVGDEKFVLDPSIEAKKPLRLHDWLSRMGNPEKMKVAICASGARSPGSDCGRVTDGIERWAQRSQERFLTLEWQRVNRLGRDWERELGEAPPWSGD